MKKVLSIVLAVMMLATVAFAAPKDLLDPDTVVTPGDEYFIAATDFEDVVDPTKKLAAAADLQDNEYSVKTVTWTKGRSLVDSVKIDRAVGQVLVTLKAHYTLEKDTDLKGTINLTSKTLATGADLKTVKAEVEVVVNNLSEEIPFSERNEEYPLSADPNTRYKVVAEEFGGGTLVLQGDEYEFVVRVYNKDKFYLASDGKVNKDVIMANEDVDADYINFINFSARPAFKASGTLKFFIDKEDYLYEIKDGKLVALKGTWNSDDGVYEVKGIKTLGSYVYSDAKLKSVPASATEDNGDGTATNPDTGANDVIGIATALAAVALVSAAAVSLKK